MPTHDSSRDRTALDPEVVRSLVDLLGDDSGALTEVVDAFLGEAPLRLAELREGSVARDPVLTGRAAHTLKSNAATFGAHRLEQLCRELEAGARADDLDGAADLVDAIEAEWATVGPELAALRDDETEP
jgi:HPt (histidine-containing phosphotransfer) domain-containing protein